MTKLNQPITRLKRHATVQTTGPVESSPPTSVASQATPMVGRAYPIQLSLTTLPLVLSDLITTLGSTLAVFGMSTLLWQHATLELAWKTSLPNPLRLVIFLTFAVPIFFYLYRLYPGTGLNPVLEFRQTTKAILILFATFLAGSLLHDNRQGYPLMLATICATSVFAVPVARTLTRIGCARFDWWGQPLIVYGSNNTAVKTYEYYRSQPSLGLRPVAMVDDTPAEDAHALDMPVRPLADASRIAGAQGIYWAIVAMPDRPAKEIHPLIDKYASSIPHVMIVQESGGLPSLWNRACDCAGLAGVQMCANLLLPIPRAMKRTMDLSIVIVGGILLLPLLGVIAATIKLTSPGPVFYRQGRVGLTGQRFRIWKFRTMVDGADAMLEACFEQSPEQREEWDRDSKLKNDRRVTTVGQWLRKTSLDELPQIWNVLVGDMSLVGPRPIMENEFEKYSCNIQGYDLYTRVRPGITGLWQISGRNDTTYAERIRLDSYYVRNWSVWFDLYVLLHTVKAVVWRQGAY